MGPRKELIIITGFESSGSVFLSKVVSHVMKKCRQFGEWSGYGWNGTAGDDLILIHRSMPYMRNPKRWLVDLQGEIEPMGDYDKKFIICTRDLSISQLSRISRFGGTMAEYQDDNNTARQCFEQIMETEDFFIFGFESALALRFLYYKTLYSWLGVQSNFNPEIFDANAPYIRIPDSR